ncbi:RING-H2 finger protein ATL52-like isoform X2 [Zingiber officinale]|nr:RING-H2 finger protein ATL52-like isoform X2 [Zingiber officinale]
MARPDNDRRGLTPAELEKLPCYEFEADEKMSDTVDCAVCLESFEVGDRCRLLPPCSHSFHAQCVDSWLLKCSVCPICRASARKATDEGWPGNFGGSGVNGGAEMRERQVVVVGVEFDQPVDHASSSRHQKGHGPDQIGPHLGSNLGLNETITPWSYFGPFIYNQADLSHPLRIWSIRPNEEQI